jgi:hypothetical protein
MRIAFVTDGFRSPVYPGGVSVGLPGLRMPPYVRLTR